MSLVGIFTKSRPSIGGRYFDAVLEESSELVTEVTRYPVEDGATGNDHAVLRPLRITMTVGVSDNVFRAIAASAGPLGGLVSNVGGTAVGALIGKAGKGVAIGTGLLAGNISAAVSAGQPATRSQSALEEIREIQRAGLVIDVVGTKSTYQNCIITNTYQRTTKENEQGLELVVELQQLLIMDSQEAPVLPYGDSSGTQAQPYNDLGEIGLA